MLDLSIIIPTLNEEFHIEQLLKRLSQNHPKIHTNILVVDAGSEDQTKRIVKEHGVRIIHSEKKNRAFQMNLGATASASSILYFVHADTLPPIDYQDQIAHSIHKEFSAGCFPLHFRSNIHLLKLNNWCSTLPFLWCRGGDQSLYITRRCWESLGPFPEVDIMEEYILLRKIFRSPFRFDIMPSRIEVSDRKYHENNYFNVQYVNFMAFRMFVKGKDPEKIKAYYRQSLFKGNKYGY